MGSSAIPPPADGEGLGTLFESLPIGAYRSAPDGSLLRANAALARLNGFERAEQLLAAVGDIGREWYVDAERRAEFRRRLEHEGQIAGFESEVFRCADRARIWVSEYAHVVRGADGRVLYYEGTVEDISQRMQAQAALARSEQFLREIADHIPGMAYRVHTPRRHGPPSRYTFVSPGVRALYGIEPEALLADALLLRPFRHPDDVARVDAEVAAAYAANQPLTVDYRIVVDGRVKWVQMSSSPVFGEHDERVRVGVVLDVTAQRQAESLQRARERADAERQQMTQFLSRVSHELRTPLNAILGFAQLIEMQSALPPSQRPWVQSLLSSGRHLLDLVTDLLDLSGAQSGQMTMAVEDVDVATVLGEAWALVAADAAARGLVFGGLPVAEGDMRLRADRRRTRQVLANLLSNAVKYNRPGGRISLAARRDGTAIEITVGDEGPGLTPAQMARLFQPFDRLGAQHGAVQGTGLGLVLSRQLAEAMGGGLQAVGGQASGCTFSLRLPAAGSA